ncbi:MAG: AI-2E family transporter [Victivallales bacterium]|jgi:predicted PurR-regulated permease PerM/uncharacterized tellurite resistance protein B-like protein|nr:AI-2E family transporter [Victivallales bacterium]
MADFSRISDGVNFRGKVERSLRKTFARAVAFFGSEDEEEKIDDAELARRLALLSLIKAVMESRGEITDSEIDSLRRLLADDFSPQRIERMISELRRAPAITVNEATTLFADQPESDRERLIRLLLILAVCNNCLSESSALIGELGSGLGFSDVAMKHIREEVIETQQRRIKILRSGAGVLVALIVIAVFILTATLLRSVVFGLIAAYIMLPLEKYFERRLRHRKGIAYWFFRFGDFIFAPLQNLAAAIRRSKSDLETKEQKAKRAERKIISQAVGLTCFVMLLCAILLLSGISALTNHYVQNLKGWTKTHISTNAPTSLVVSPPDEESGEGKIWSDGVGKLIDEGQIYLDHLRERFQNLPLVKWGLDQVGQVLHDKSTQRELASYLLARTGGLFSFTAGVLGTIGVVISDLLLTIFFFLLFLIKLAEFCGPVDGSRRKRQSEYIVRTVFNGSWLPGANSEAIGEAQRIIGEVIEKLRVWVRGYLTLMVLDATVYTTVFFFLGVPYFAILGPLAGCGILLPYIGPILSASLTILVTLAVGGSAISGLQLAGIIVAYLIYNGVIEQFILYPAVIGDSLGLTTLETIIVVLLGAIFAGIAGMILALPAASVIKYLVPQIYHAWGSRPRQGGARE